MSGSCDHGHEHPPPAAAHSGGGGHGHAHAPLNYGRAFAIGIGLNIGFVIVELIGGFLYDSLALLADALHNLGDVVGLLAAWGAVLLSRFKPSGRRTYGLRRSTILIALLNGAFLLVLMGMLAWEAIGRFAAPPAVPGLMVSAVALVGLVINTVTALLFVRGRDDLTIRSAFLHMAADAAVSGGVAVAGLLLYLTGAAWIDPVVSLLIVLVVVWSTWGLVRDALDLALDAVPTGIDPEAVRSYLAGLPGVTTVHDLHIWAMSTTESALTAHLVRSDPSADDDLLACASRDLRDRFHIGHATLQLERPDLSCPLDRIGGV